MLNARLYARYFEGKFATNKQWNPYSWWSNWIKWYYGSHWITTSSTERKTILPSYTKNIFRRRRYFYNIETEGYNSTPSIWFVFSNYRLYQSSFSRPRCAGDKTNTLSYRCKFSHRKKFNWSCCKRKTSCSSCGIESTFWWRK